MKFYAWLAASIFFAFAIAVPLLLLGAPREAIWPICLISGAVFMFVRPGGTVEKLVGGVLTYGLIFSVWCVGGFIFVLILALFFSDIRPPLSLFIVAGVGAFGVVRELSKSEVASKPGDSDA